MRNSTKFMQLCVQFKQRYLGFFLNKKSLDECVIIKTILSSRPLSLEDTKDSILFTNTFSIENSVPYIIIPEQNHTSGNHTLAWGMIFKFLKYDFQDQFKNRNPFLTWFSRSYPGNHTPDFTKYNFRLWLGILNT